MPVPIIVSPLHQTQRDVRDVSRRVEPGVRTRSEDRQSRRRRARHGAQHAESGRHVRRTAHVQRMAEQPVRRRWRATSPTAVSVATHPTGVMESCQDCHMPDVFTGGCFLWENEPFFASRRHADAQLRRCEHVGALGCTSRSTAPTPASDANSRGQRIQARVVQMLRAASDLDLRSVRQRDSCPRDQLVRSQAADGLPRRSTHVAERAVPRRQ